MNCLYPNGGAFGFPPETNPKIRGWIGPADPTIKPNMLPLVRNVHPPFEKTLARLARTAWQQFLPGNVWIMPASHWSFELTHGSSDWLADAIKNIQIDATPLIDCTNAAAIEFSMTEIDPFERFVKTLLENLLASDFLIAFPGRSTICTLHHHKQLWWVAISDPLLAALDSLVHNDQCA